MKLNEHIEKLPTISGPALSYVVFQRGDGQREEGVVCLLVTVPGTCSCSRKQKRLQEQSFRIKVLSSASLQTVGAQPRRGG